MLTAVGRHLLRASCGYLHDDIIRTFFNCFDAVSVISLSWFGRPGFYYTLHRKYVLIESVKFTKLHVCVITTSDLAETTVLSKWSQQGRIFNW